jgi:DNA-directed RNA polymerase subunit RPC12/RpoP
MIESGLSIQMSEQSNQEHFIRFRCRYCDGHVSFDEVNLGRTVDCPHCGKKIVLRNPKPSQAGPGVNFAGLASGNIVSLALGTLGTIIGVLVLLGAWIPFLGRGGIPIAVTGLGLSVAGLGFACFQKFKAIQLPMLGCLVCLGAVCFSVFTNQEANRGVSKAGAMQEQALRNKAGTDARVRKMQEAAAEAARTSRLASLQAEVANLSLTMTNQLLAVAEAEADVARAQGDYKSFIDGKPYLTNAVYLKILQQHDSDVWQFNGLMQPQVFDFTRQGVTRHSMAERNYLQEQALDSAAAEQSRDNLDQRIQVENQQLQSIVDTATQFQQDKLGRAEVVLLSAKAALEATQQSIRNYQKETVALESPARAVPGFTTQESGGPAR